jgi:hypothetical protein
VTVTEYGYTTQAARDMSAAGMEQCPVKLAHALEAGAAGQPDGIVAAALGSR